ncbi:hypothetical protein [Ferruginibacter sp.]
MSITKSGKTTLILINIQKGFDTIEECAIIAATDFIKKYFTCNNS